MRHIDRYITDNIGIFFLNIQIQKQGQNVKKTALICLGAYPGTTQYLVQCRNIVKGNKSHNCRLNLFISIQIKNIKIFFPTILVNEIHSV